MKKSKKVVGTLLPLFALTNPDFKSAQVFLDWLKKTDQSAWLLLPLHETQLEKGSKTKHVPSPYKSYGIGLDPRYQSAPDFVQDEVSRNNFISKHKDWIHDYALFCALRDHFGTDDWVLWDEDIRRRVGDAIQVWTDTLKDSVNNYISQQWQLHESYALLHAKATVMGISLIGDLPYYPSFRSPLVWAHQEVFQIADDGSLPYVSGIPDTIATHFGRQIWGHPLYNWEHQKEIVLDFWKMRLRYLAAIFDHIRFDHAKAFFAYGVMDVADERNDMYQDGPGAEVFKELVVYAQQHGLTIFAEDSGDKTQSLRKSMQDLHIAGLRIFRFALRGNELNSRYADLQRYPENSVAYTTTHDTETLLSYIQSLDTNQKALLSTATGINYTTDKAFARGLRNALITSPAKTVIIPIQDWLLTTDRINVPGTEKEINDTNWHFKLSVPVEDLPTAL